MYQIYIRDSNRNRIGEITDFTKLDLIPRFNGVGSFVLDMPTDCHEAKQLIAPKAGIIVKKNGITIFSGTVTKRRRTFSANGDNLTLSGKDDNHLLDSRLSFPEVNGNFALKDYDVRTGEAEKVMKEYVNFNLGNSALPERRLLTVEGNKGLGSKVTGRARFHSLLDLLSSLALSGGGLGFRVVQVGTQLEFQVNKPEDKTRTAFFSPLLGNLASFEYTNENPEANFVVVGGGGQGKDRMLLSKSDSVSISKFGRFESFVDRRDTIEVDELQQSLDEELTTKAEQNQFSFTPIDTPQLSFGKDYSLGDKVSVVLTQPNEVVDIETLYYFISTFQSVPVDVERVRKIQEKLDVIQDIVREVKISITPEGDSIVPVVGTEETNKHSILGIFDKMKQLTKRIHHLERS